MRIDVVIRKYNLQLDDQYVSQLLKGLTKDLRCKDLRFKWTNIDGGHVLARFAKTYAKIGTEYVYDFYRTVFAGKIEFSSKNGKIRCGEWVWVDKDKYEEQIKNLYKQYERACLLKKKFLEKERLTKLNKDFR